MVLHALAICNITSGGIWVCQQLLSDVSCVRSNSKLIEQLPGTCNLYSFLILVVPYDVITLRARGRSHQYMNTLYYNMCTSIFIS
jgi:hypothetical protein